MTFSLYTNSVSAHQLPLAREIAKRVGTANFRYVSRNEKLQGGAQEVESTELWVTDDTSELESCDVLLVGGLRPIDLMENRLKNGKTTLYMSERWFKPIPFCKVVGCELYLSGWLRLFVPAYWKMARRFARLFAYSNYRFLPIGPWSLRDMKMVCWINGIKIPDGSVVPWGDFVEPSKKPPRMPMFGTGDPIIRILWAGRMLWWKHVETIIRAVGYLNAHSRMRAALTIVGDGPEKARLRNFADMVNADNADSGNLVTFITPVPIEEVRDIMHKHDVYVLASNWCEGWGAVVPEALEEGMLVLGTYEAGASAALLPDENLFHCGDWRTLADKLANLSACKHISLPKDYTPSGATERLLAAITNG